MSRVKTLQRLPLLLENYAFNACVKLGDGKKSGFAACMLFKLRTSKDFAAGALAEALAGVAAGDHVYFFYKEKR